MAVQLDLENELARKGHRMILSGQPVTLHCHHYNINLQKTLEDILGEEGVLLLYGPWRKPFMAASSPSSSITTRSRR